MKTNDKQKTQAPEQSPEEFNAAKMQEVEAKKEELEKKHNCKITPIVFRNPETKKIDAVGYLKEPSLQAEMAYMDKVTRFPFSAGEDILDLCIIKEESDPRLYTATNENKEFYKGAIYEVNKSVTFFANGYDTFKKK